MEPKITLITPPDFYESSTTSILLMGLSEKDQQLASEWLGKHMDKRSINLYFYNGEPDVAWLLYATARSDFLFLSYNSGQELLNLMGSYIASRPNCFYTTDDVNIKMALNHINNNFVPGIIEFFKQIFSE
jgi:hypothetical protein